MLMNGLPMLGDILSGTAISCATFHYGAIYLIHKVADERGLEIMVVTGFASADFHSHTTSRLNTQGLVDLDKRFGRNLRGVIHPALCTAHNGHHSDHHES